MNRSLLKKLSEKLRESLWLPEKIFQAPSMPNFKEEREKGTFTIGEIYSVKNKRFNGKLRINEPFILVTLADREQPVINWLRNMSKNLIQRNYVIVDGEGSVKPHFKGEEVSFLQIKKVKLINFNETGRGEMIFLLTNLLSYADWFTSTHKGVVRFVLNVFYEGFNEISFTDFLGGLESYSVQLQKNQEAIEDLKELAEYVASLEETTPEKVDLVKERGNIVICMEEVEFTKVKEFLYPFILIQILRSKPKGKTIVLKDLHCFSGKKEAVTAFKDYLNKLLKNDNNVIMMFNNADVDSSVFSLCNRHLLFNTYLTPLNRAWKYLENTDKNLPQFLRHLDTKCSVYLNKAKPSLMLLTH